MTETNGPAAPPPGYAASEESLRTLSLIVYGLYIAALFNGLTAVLGVILAYVKRHDAWGTPWYSHFDNQITTFWVVLVAFVLLIPFYVTLIGAGALIGIATWPVSIFAAPLFLMMLCVPLGLLITIWALYRTIKGLVRAIDGMPYA